MSEVVCETSTPDLTCVSDDVKRSKFARMLAVPERDILLVGVAGPDLPGLHEAVSRFNTAEARAAAGTSAADWVGLRVVVWEGIWCIRASLRRNKRRVPDGPPGPDPTREIVSQLAGHLLRVHLQRPRYESAGLSKGALVALKALGITGITFASSSTSIRGVLESDDFMFLPSLGLGPEDWGAMVGVDIGAGGSPMDRVKEAADRLARYSPSPSYVLPGSSLPVERPRAHPFGETYPPRRGGKAARKMQRRSRR